MKKLIAMILAVVMMSIGVCAFADNEMITGGWSVNEDVASPIPEEIIDYLNSALDGLLGATYEPVALLGQQVVAGMNYCILCKTTPVVPNPVSVLTLVYIYVDLDGNAEITQVADLDLGFFSTEAVG